MKVKAGFYLEEITIKRIAAMAAGTHRDKSDIVDMAIELLARQDEFAQLDLSKSARKPAKKAKKANKPFLPDVIPGVSKGMMLAVQPAE